jgi:TonB family protein
MREVVRFVIAASLVVVFASALAAQGAQAPPQKVPPALPAGTVTAPVQQGADDEPALFAIRFDAMGVEFYPWLHAFIPQLKRTWKNQTAAIQDKGHVEVYLTVHRDGTIMEVKIRKRSASPSIDQAALKALTSSSPTPPLPPEFPKGTCLFSITFYCNEVVPSPIRRPEA